jgi:hypothetical protein
MNLQEHIGNYLFLKQLERQEQYELLIAAKIDNGIDVKNKPNQIMNQLELVEILSTTRSGENIDEKALENSLNLLWGDDEYAHLQGWIRVDDLSNKERLKAQIQPLYYRPYNDKVSLKSLIKIMRQKNRRFPLPQALHLTQYTIKATLSLSQLWPEAITKIDQLVHVGYQGELSIHDHHLNEIILGVNQPSIEPIHADSFQYIAILLTALTCDIHLVDPVLNPSSSMIQNTLNERFQGPPNLKLKLNELIEKLLSENVDPNSKILGVILDELNEAIKVSSLDCPPSLIETFLNSVYPFESAQSKRELQRLKQRSLEALLPSSSRLRISAVDDFLDGDEHTQSTLTIVPRHTPSVEMYDALSTDSGSGSSEDFSVDDEANGFTFDPGLLSQVVNIDHQHHDKEEINEADASPNSDTEQPIGSKVKKNESIDLPLSESDPTPPKQGLLPPRPSDIHSLEAQARRDRGRKINTMDLLAPIDDFDSIDITGVKAEELREMVLKEEKSPSKEQDGHFAGSFKYPDNYKVPAPVVPAPVVPAPVVTSARVKDHHVKAEAQQGYYDSVPVKQKRSSPILLAAILAVLTAFGSNYLAQYFTQINSEDTNQTTTKISSPPPVQRALPNQKKQAVKIQTKPGSKSKTPPATQSTLLTVNPAPKLIWVNQELHPKKTIRQLQDLNLNDEDIITLWRNEYLPISIPFKALKTNTNTEESSEINLTKGDGPLFTLKLKISPRGSDTTVLLNGIPQEKLTSLQMPLSIPSSIEVLRPKYQNHFIFIKPTPKSLNQQSIFLKSTQRAKQTVTLRSSVGTAQLIQELKSHPKGKRELGEGLSRLVYDFDTPLKLGVESKGMIGDHWRFTPHKREIPPAYTLRLEPRWLGLGKISFKGGYGLEVSMTPLKDESDSKTNVKPNYKLPRKLSLDAGVYRVTIFDQKAAESYHFITTVYADQNAIWQVKKHKTQTADSKRIWRVDFVRFKELKRSKRIKD